MAVKRLPALDTIDVKILAGLQRDGRSTIQSLAQRVGLSARACLERVRRLEAAGIIAGYQAVIELRHLSRPVNVFADIVLEKHANSLRGADQRIDRRPQSRRRPHYQSRGATPRAPLRRLSRIAAQTEGAVTASTSSCPGRGAAQKRCTAEPGPLQAQALKVPVLQRSATACRGPK